MTIISPHLSDVMGEELNINNLIDFGIMCILAEDAIELYFHSFLIGKVEVDDPIRVPGRKVRIVLFFHLENIEDKPAPARFVCGSILL